MSEISVGEYAKSMGVKAKVVVSVLKGADFDGGSDPETPMKKKQLTHMAKLTEKMIAFLASEFEGEKVEPQKVEAPAVEASVDTEPGVRIIAKEKGSSVSKLYHMNELPSLLYAQLPDGTWPHRGAKGDDGLAEVIFNNWNLSAPWVEKFKELGIPYNREELRVEIGQMPADFKVSAEQAQKLALNSAIKQPTVGVVPSGE